MYSLSGGRRLAPRRASSDPTARKRGNSRGAKGAGHPRRDGVNGKPEELIVLPQGGSLSGVARAG
jgi:hypothetical protein